MLRKIISIKAVGRFLNCGASGDVELKRYNLVFAENGRGKSTLCAILRSLQSGDPTHVRGRTTLGGTDTPEIQIRLEGGNANFTNGAWSAELSELAIFDSTFISENVYSGDAVGLEHRRNLYGVIVGKQGRDLARQIDELDAAGRAKNADIREKTAAIQVLVPPGATIEAFLYFEEDPAISTKITAAERDLEAVKQADQIRTRAALSELALPAFPAGFEALLRKTLEGVAEDAERRVAGQIEAHAMHERGRTWLSEGLGYIRNDACPFCGQGLRSVELIAGYRTYFSEAYNALRTEIGALRQQIETALGDRQIATVERTLDHNVAAVEFWLRYSEITPPALAGAESVGDTIRALRQTALGLLDRKAAAPLDRLEPDAAFTEAHAALGAAQAAATAYNAAVRAANAVIAAKKAATGGADFRTVESALTTLRAIKKRHDPDGRKACEDYHGVLAEKRAIDDKKGEVRQQLDDYTKQVIGQYEKTINRFLEEFNAGFRITDTKHAYPGGVASSSYQILINETPVELGDPETPLDKPSFRNTLSSGDRSTLALAFFLAQLEHDPDRASRIVAFDDPFNSQDGFRKDCTVQKIKKCGETSAQVIVLSHDQTFLKRIWDRLQPADRKCLELKRIGLTNTTMCEWDIEKATQDAYNADRKVLTDYYHSNIGNSRDVVQKIRPVLESFCKTLGAGALGENDTLGVIIEKLRAAGPAHQLFSLCEGLEELNEYTKRYHHGENPHAATEPINDGELQGMVKKTVTITGGC